MNHEFWYLSRSAGFTAYLLLFVSVALGIAMGTRLVERFARRNLIFDIHRFTTILALAFTLFHVYILLADGYFNFNVWQLSIPFLSPYRSWQTASGVFALYIMAIVIVSFYVRQHIGYRAWRALHYLTFGLFALAMLHGITAGTDTTEPWAKLIYLGTGAGIAALIAYRLQYRLPDSPAVRTARLASASATIIAGMVLVFGTGLLTSARGASTTGSDQSSAAADGQAGHPFLQSFTADLSGTYQQDRTANGSSLALDAAISGDLNARFHAELVQTVSSPTPDNENAPGEGHDDEDAEARPQTSVTTNKAELLDAASGATLCDGKLTALNNGTLRVACSGTGPYEGVNMVLASSVDAGRDGTLSGALSGTMER